MSSPSKTSLVNALIIGGGPAGLSAALGLARQHKSSIVFSDSKFRNAGAHTMHGVISRDHEKPAVFREIARTQIEKYGYTQFIDKGVSDVVKREEEGQTVFKATTSDGQTWNGLKVVMATGCTDGFPDIDGFIENWPENIYGCLFCDGHERQDLPKGILHFLNQDSLKVAMMAKSLSTDASMVTIFLDGASATAQDVKEPLRTLEKMGFTIEPRRIRRLQSLGEGLEVHFEDGDKIFMGFLVYRPESSPAAPHLYESLGVEIVKTPMGPLVKRNEPFGATNVMGVFASGDAAGFLKHVTMAMQQGMMCAAGIVMELHDEEVEAATKALEKS